LGVQHPALWQRKELHPVSRFDVDLDEQINHLELEWRLVYDASIGARAEYQVLAARSSAKVEVLDMARERLEQADAKKAHIMAKIERLEEAMLRQRRTRRDYVRHTPSR
jgi:hypothetical protein